MDKLPFSNDSVKEENEPRTLWIQEGITAFKPHKQEDLLLTEEEVRHLGLSDARLLDPSTLKILKAQLDKAHKGKEAEIADAVKQGNACILLQLFDRLGCGISEGCIVEPTTGKRFHKASLENFMELVKSLLEQAKHDERERIINYLRIRWACYESNNITGKSRHTFKLAENWKEALKGR